MYKFRGWCGRYRRWLGWRQRVATVEWKRRKIGFVLKVCKRDEAVMGGRVRAGSRGDWKTNEKSYCCLKYKWIYGQHTSGQILREGLGINEFGLVLKKATALTRSRPRGCGSVFVQGVLARENRPIALIPGMKSIQVICWLLDRRFSLLLTFWRAVCPAAHSWAPRWRLPPDAWASRCTGRRRTAWRRPRETRWWRPPPWRWKPPSRAGSPWIGKIKKISRIILWT